ncbi:MAG: hypothetical protein AB7F19_04930 [Candidatus Babeliales bacterium]
MQQHTGIVLKRYMPKKQKISLLDAHLGRIEAVIRDERLIEMVWPGMELAYIPTEGAGVHFLDNASLQAAPFVSAQQDIGFLHHILELSYYFLELHDVTPEIFPLVQFICVTDVELSREQKMMVIGKFLWQLRQEIEMLQDKIALQRLLALPLESMLKETVDSREIAHLFCWIRHAILCHPQRAYFKTSGFMLNIGAL